MEQNKEKFNYYPITLEVSDNAPHEPFRGDSPEKIMTDLLQAEKEIAAEGFRSLKAKYESEKTNWEKVFAQKEQEILILKGRIAQFEERTKMLQKQLNQEKNTQIEQLELSVKELEGKKLNERRKWEKIESEVTLFKNDALLFQNKYLEEQEKLRKAKKVFADQISALREEIRSYEERFAKLQEQGARKEDGWLREKGHVNDQLNILKDQVEKLHQIIDAEKQGHAKTIDKKDSQLYTLEKEYRTSIETLNKTIQKERELVQKVDSLNQHIDRMEEEKNALRQEFEQKNILLRKERHAEYLKWESEKKDLLAKEESVRKEYENQVKSAVKAVEILEQQLTDEQRARREAEAQARKKEEEAARLLKQREEVSLEWKNVMLLEQQNFKKRHSELQLEYQTALRAKENEMGKLFKEISAVTAALSDEKRSLELEIEKNKQLTQHIQHSEEYKKNLQNKMESMEKEWRSSLEKERGYCDTEVEKVKLSLGAIIADKENEVLKINEKMSQLYLQLNEATRALAQEKDAKKALQDTITSLENALHDNANRQEKEKADVLKKQSYKLLELEKELTHITHEYEKLNAKLKNADSEPGSLLVDPADSRKKEFPKHQNISRKKSGSRQSHPITHREKKT